MNNSVTPRKKRGKPFEAGNPGRPKGAVNRFTSLKDAFLDAFNEIGGKDALSAWAKQSKNRAEFYRIISKLFPKEIELTGADGGPIQFSDTERAVRLEYLLVNAAERINKPS